ncbi:MAG: hypothetical protein HQL69_14420 [Magnetococcales bacterium]|nr:hypothetical protein [Magnetococcales bacterium]
MNISNQQSETLYKALTPSVAPITNRFATNGKKSGIQALLAVGYFAMAVVVNETAGSTGLFAMGFLLLTATYVLGRSELLRHNSLSMTGLHSSGQH